MSLATIGMLDVVALKAARQKYLRLGRELEELLPSPIRENLMHTHSKLGIFLSDTVGHKVWQEASE